jgi:hypothetical protein
MEDVGIFYDHLVNFPAIWHILSPFGMFPSVLVHFYPFWNVLPRKSGNPAPRQARIPSVGSS